MTGAESGSIQKQLAGPGSSLQKYKKTVVGNKGFLYLFGYEAVAFVTDSLPGDWGVHLRTFCYSVFLENCGTNIRIGKKCSFKRPGAITLGDRVQLDEEVALDVKTGGRGIAIADDCVVGRKTIFSNPGGKISIGKASTIGQHCRLGSMQGLTIGEGCSIGDFTYIVGAGHATDSLTLPIIEQPLTCKGPNIVGDNVTVGDQVTILDGVTVGNDVYIEPGSLVTRDVESGCRVAGVPAQVK